MPYDLGCAWIEYHCQQSVSDSPLRTQIGKSERTHQRRQIIVKRLRTIFHLLLELLREFTKLSVELRGQSLDYRELVRVAFRGIDQIRGDLERRDVDNQEVVTVRLAISPITQPSSVRSFGCRARKGEKTDV